VVGRLENTADVRGMTGHLGAPFESFPTFDQAMKTALREISNAALAPRAA
jgi:hypothetical protein